jgi:hypothetical protein
MNTPSLPDITAQERYAPTRNFGGYYVNPWQTEESNK